MNYIYYRDNIAASEIVKSRFPYAMKKYTSAGKRIPLKNDWANMWCSLPCHYDQIFDQIYNFAVRPDDVYVVTFMKAGTTWMQETVWMLVNNLDYRKAEEIGLNERSCFLDRQGVFPIANNSSIDRCNNMTSPRLIKCHMPAQLLPVQIWEKKQKIIYVARNVKDVIVSSYHMLNKLFMWKGNNIEDYVEDFLNDEIIFTSYWSHLLSFWKMRHEPFIFFVTYEEMKNDMANVLQRLCTFLERSELTTEELEKLIEHLSFESMKDNKQINQTQRFRTIMPNIKEDFEFLRRGIVGSYKDELTPELQDKIDKWSRKILKQHNITEEDIFGKF